MGLNAEQLIRRRCVSTFNRTGCRLAFPKHPSRRLFHREENCIGSIACFQPVACGFFCAGSHYGCSAGTDRRTASAAAGSRLCLGWRLSPLGGRSLCVDPWPLGPSAASWWRLGSPPLGPSPWRVDPDRGSLALSKNQVETLKGTDEVPFSVLRGNAPLDQNVTVRAIGNSGCRRLYR